MANIYYLFSVNDKFFTDFSKYADSKKLFKSYSGMAYAKTDAFEQFNYKRVKYIPDLIEGASEFDQKYLRKIEDDYGVVLSDLIHADRHLMRFEKNIRLPVAQKIIKAFISDMVELDINVVFSEGLDDLLSYFAAIYCRKHRIRYAYMISTRMGDRMMFSNRCDTGPINFEYDYYKAIKDSAEGALELSEIKQQIADYVAEKKQPFYITSGLNYKPFSLSDLRTLFNYFVRYFKDRKGLHYQWSPLSLPLNRLKRIYQRTQYNSLERFIDRPSSKRYFIYPLHFHPEAATLIQGRWFNDQVRLIELISKNLPVDVTLVVKEHKHSIGRRPFSFYQELSSYHNVELAHEDCDVYGLISGSVGVITISSTMGFEALLLGKPVISFGDIFYNYSENVYQATDFSSLNLLIQDVLKHEFTEDDVAAMVYVLQKDSFCIGNYSPENYDTSTFDELASIASLALDEE